MFYSPNKGWKDDPWMYQKVENHTQMELFNHMWKESFSEKKYELEEYSWNAQRYLIQNKCGELKGTIELIPYTRDVEKSTIEDMFPFSSLEITKTTPLHQIYEIDKLSVYKEGRKEGTLENILKFMLEFARQNDVLYYFALINPLLFRAIKIAYEIPVERAGKLIKTKEYPIQPMYIDVEKVMQLQNHPFLSLKST